MESKGFFGFDETGDLEGPASAMRVQQLNTWEEVGFDGQEEPFSRT